MDSSLFKFLSDHGIDRLEAALQQDTLDGLVNLLFEDGRPTFLKAMLQRGVNVHDRLLLAGILDHASMTGVDGVAESMAQVEARSAWLKGPIEHKQESWKPHGHPFLVFTSAGDANNIAHWVALGKGQSKNFEVCVVYYGKQSDPECLRLADCGMRSAGGKFPNLLKAVRKQVTPYDTLACCAVRIDTCCP